MEPIYKKRSKTGAAGTLKDRTVFLLTSSVFSRQPNFFSWPGSLLFIAGQTLLSTDFQIAILTDARENLDSAILFIKLPFALSLCRRCSCSFNYQLRPITSCRSCRYRRVRQHLGANPVYGLICALIRHRRTYVNYHIKFFGNSQEKTTTKNSN